MEDAYGPSCGPASFVGFLSYMHKVIQYAMSDVVENISDVLPSYRWLVPGSQTIASNAKKTPSSHGRYSMITEASDWLPTKLQARYHSWKLSVRLHCGSMKLCHAQRKLQIIRWHLKRKHRILCFQWPCTQLALALFIGAAWLHIFCWKIAPCPQLRTSLVAAIWGQVKNRVQTVHAAVHTSCTQIGATMNFTFVPKRLEEGSPDGPHFLRRQLGSMSPVRVAYLKKLMAAWHMQESVEAVPCLSPKRLAQR